MQKRTLASKLKNRIEIYRNKLVNGKLGDEYKPELLKTVWANIIPLNGKIVNGEGETQYSEKRFKIIIRKTDVKENTDFIMYKGQRYEIDYIIPDYKSNSYLEVNATLRID